MPTRHQLEAAWAKAKQPVTGKPTVIFDRRRRMHLLFELLFVAGFILLLFCLIAGVR